jgi:hypothetical protein
MLSEMKRQTEGCIVRQNPGQLRLGRRAATAGMLTRSEWSPAMRRQARAGLFLARDGRMGLRRWLPVRASFGIDGEVDTADIAGCFLVGLQGLAAYEIQAIICDCFFIYQEVFHGLSALLSELTEVIVGDGDHTV